MGGAWRSFAQMVNGKPMKPAVNEILSAKVLRFGVDSSYFKIVDGVIHRERYVPLAEVAKEWTISEKDVINAMAPGSPADTVYVTNTVNTALEQYLFGKIKSEIDTIPFKLPIVLNEHFYESYRGRREALKYIKPAAVKSIVFVPREPARQKYGNAVLFGVIEISK